MKDFFFVYRNKLTNYSPFFISGKKIRTLPKWNVIQSKRTGQVIVLNISVDFVRYFPVTQSEEHVTGQRLTLYNPIRGEGFINRDNNCKCRVFTALSQLLFARSQVTPHVKLFFPLPHPHPIRRSCDLLWVFRFANCYSFDGENRQVIENVLH